MDDAKYISTYLYVIRADENLMFLHFLFLFLLDLVKVAFIKF